jgi:hypothetical protein
METAAMERGQFFSGPGVPAIDRDVFRASKRGKAPGRIDTAIERGAFWVVTVVERAMLVRRAVSPVERCEFRENFVAGGGMIPGQKVSAVHWGVICSSQIVSAVAAVDRGAAVAGRSTTILGDLAIIPHWSLGLSGLGCTVAGLSLLPWLLGDTTTFLHSRTHSTLFPGKETV